MPNSALDVIPANLSFCANARKIIGFICANLPVVVVENFKCPFHCQYLLFTGVFYITHSIGMKWGVASVGFELFNQQVLGSE